MLSDDDVKWFTDCYLEGLANVGDVLHREGKTYRLERAETTGGKVHLFVRCVPDEVMLEFTAMVL